MKKIVPLIIMVVSFYSVKAQVVNTKDSVVQLYGVVMTADSLRGLTAVSIVVKGQNRGTITNEQGVFSIVVLKGDEIEFSSIGYKPKLVHIPIHLDGNQYSIIQLMVADTVYLPTTIIKRRPSREQFERDFVNIKIPDDALTTARKNIEESKRSVLIATLPPDGREAVNNVLRQNAVKYYYAGQAPPMNIFNPFAWAEFINAWKRGDFKRKSSESTSE